MAQNLSQFLNHPPKTGKEKDNIVAQSLIKQPFQNSTWGSVEAGQTLHVLEEERVSIAAEITYVDMAGDADEGTIEQRELGHFESGGENFGDVDEFPMESGKATIDLLCQEQVLSQLEGICSPTVRQVETPAPKEEKMRFTDLIYRLRAQDNEAYLTKIQSFSELIEFLYSLQPIKSVYDTEVKSWICTQITTLARTFEDSNFSDFNTAELKLQMESLITLQTHSEVPILGQQVLKKCLNRILLTKDLTLFASDDSFYRELQERVIQSLSENKIEDMNIHEGVWRICQTQKKQDDNNKEDLLKQVMWTARMGGIRQKISKPFTVKLGKCGPIEAHIHIQRNNEQLDLFVEETKPIKMPKKKAPAQSTVNIISTKVLAQQKRRSVPDCFRKLTTSGGLRQVRPINFGLNVTSLARQTRPRPLSQINFRNIYQPKVKLRGRSVDSAPLGIRNLIIRKPSRDAPAIRTSFKSCLGRRSITSFSKGAVRHGNDRTRGARLMSTSWKKQFSQSRSSIYRKPLGTRKTDFLNKDLAPDNRAKSALKQRALPIRPRSQALNPAPQAMSSFSNRQFQTSAKPNLSSTRQSRQRSAPMFSMRQMMKNYNQIVQYQKQSTLQQVLPGCHTRSRTPNHFSQTKSGQSKQKRPGNQLTISLDATRPVTHQRSKSTAIPKRRPDIYQQENTKALTQLLHVPAPRVQAHEYLAELIAEQAKALNAKRSTSIPVQIYSAPRISIKKPNDDYPAPRDSKPELAQDAEPTKSCSQRSQGQENDEKIEQQQATSTSDNDLDLQVIQLEVALAYTGLDGHRTNTNSLDDILLPNSAPRPSFRKYLGSVPIQDSLDVGLKFYQNPNQRLENNLQILQIIQNYHNLVKNFQSSITFDELQAFTIMNLIESKDYLKRLHDTLKFCVLIQTELVPLNGQLTQRAHELSNRINWSLIEQQALLSAQCLMNVNNGDRKTFGESELIRMMTKEQLIQRSCQRQMPSSRYQLIENLNTSKNSPYLEGRMRYTDELTGMRRIRKQLEFDQSIYGQNVGQASVEEVNQELVGNGGVLIIQDSALDVEKDVIQDKAPEPINSDLDDVTTANQEVSRTENPSALEVLNQGSEIQIRQLKNLHKNELVQRYEHFCKKSASMNFASPQQSRQNLLAMPQNTEYIEDPHQEAQREQRATDQSCHQELEITQSLSQIQSEIQNLLTTNNLLNASPLSMNSQSDYGHMRSQNQSFIRQLNLQKSNQHCNTLEREVEDTLDWQDGGIQFNKQISQKVTMKQMLSKCESAAKKPGNNELSDHNCFNLLQLSKEFMKETFDSIDTLNDQEHMSGSSQYCESNAFVQDNGRPLSKNLRRRQQVLLASNSNISNLVRNYNKNARGGSVSLDRDIRKQSIYESKNMKNRFEEKENSHQRSLSEEVNIPLSEATLEQQDLLPDPIQIQLIAPTQFKVRPNSVCMFGSNDTESRLITSGHIQGAKQVQRSKYQQMFVKSGHHKSKILQQREIREKSSNLNERLAMSILNSPNSYGSNANARTIINRTQQSQYLQDQWMKQEFSKSANSSGLIPMKKRNSLDRACSILNSNIQNDQNTSIDFQNLHSYNNRNIFQMQSAEATDPARRLPFTQHSQIPGSGPFNQSLNHIDQMSLSNPHPTSLINTTALAALAQHSPRKASTVLTQTPANTEGFSHMSLLPSLFLPSSFTPSQGDFTPPNRDPFTNHGNLETGNFGQQWTKMGILSDIQPELNKAVVNNRQKYRIPKPITEELGIQKQKTDTLTTVQPLSTTNVEVLAKNKKKYQKFTRFLEREQQQQEQQRRKSKHVLAKILQDVPGSGQNSQQYSGHQNTLRPTGLGGSSMGSACGIHKSSPPIGTLGTVGAGLTSDFRTVSHIPNNKCDSMKSNSFHAGNYGHLGLNTGWTGLTHASACSQLPVPFAQQPGVVLNNDWITNMENQIQSIQGSSALYHPGGDSPLSSHHSPFPPVKQTKKGKENQAPAFSLSLFKRN